ncbi:4-hydroxybenzoate octaprenyltransferase [Marinicauda pacifica]|uniref:4-hydroxybenzoate octaprenyltransferase n=1 Tax=Marinicauda pacifica TaxID=1133559 RepID=A0A4S2HFJ0_9PROT|nr:4-hydroxybenzoate octaprenyltransferase [Marinicauda pacifica]TGY94874.1 4-hydroxybenzoate octaprenyltransferase [Marinicauda pacifica]GGE39544.1 4-hydroxybenzoate octaprenyltransferase [Marinicauda pacifica]
MSLARDRRVADSLPKTWVDRAPGPVRPYLRLARYDRPAGFWLLALPCFQGLALAGIGSGLGWVDLYYALLFAIGAVAMRGAGCTYNDIVDRDLDAQVARTANRPLVAGTVSLKRAWVFLVAQSLVGLLVLIQLPPVAIATGLGALVLVAGYPFMKRITWWPQAWLGLTFNWGALVAFAAGAGGFALEAFLLYASGLFWTLGYDTIYACQDIEDDALVGVKSSARALGPRILPGLWIFYALSALLAVAAGVVAGASLVFAVLVSLYAAHLFSQLLRVDLKDGASCLSAFKSNRTSGLLLVLAYAAAAFAI